MLWADQTTSSTLLLLGRFCPSNIIGTFTFMFFVKFLGLFRIKSVFFIPLNLISFRLVMIFSNQSQNSSDLMKTNMCSVEEFNKNMCDGIYLDLSCYHISVTLSRFRFVKLDESSCFILNLMCTYIIKCKLLSLMRKLFMLLNSQQRGKKQKGQYCEIDYRREWQQHKVEVEK